MCLRQGAVRRSLHPYPVRSGTPLGVSAIAFYTAKCSGGLSRRPHVHPPCGMVRRCQGAARGWYLNSPHRECLYHILGSVCGHTEGVCSLFVHLHLNRECNPCPCRSSRYLGASFPFSPPPPLMRSPSPARAGEAWLRGVFSQNHAISASPADAGEVASAASRWGRPCRTRLCGWCSYGRKLSDGA